MVTRFPLARAQAALSIPTSYRRRQRFTFARGGVVTNMEAVAASFTQDARRNGRWDGRMSFLGLDSMPERPGDLLTPFGTTVSVELGLELLDGSTSYVPYGVYDLDTSSAEISADSRSLDVGLIDLSDRVDRYRFESSYPLAPGRTLSQVVNDIVTNRTGINPNVSPVSATLGSFRFFGLETGTGPWDELLEVLESFSLTAWYRRDGTIGIGSPNPSISSAYVLTSPTSLRPDFDSRPANVVVARGERQDDEPPVQGIAMDTDPGSPTYAGTGPGTSPYGRKTEFYSSPLLTTNAQALSAAQTILARNLGASATYTLTTAYDPTVDAGDVVSYGGNTYVIDAVTLDANGDTTMRARRLS